MSEPGPALADLILKRIAERYKNCEIKIFPNLPELSPVEAVLRCAQEEGFVLSNWSAPAAPQATGGLRELVARWRKEGDESRGVGRRIHHQFADELEAVLNAPAQADPAPAGLGEALKKGGCEWCGGSEQHEVGHCPGTLKGGDGSM